MNVHIFKLLIVAFMEIHIMFASKKRSTIYKINIDEYYTPCENVECTKTALDIAINLNRSVDPCDNFYQFACGGWAENYPTNPWNPIIDVFTILNSRTAKNIKEILEDSPKANDTLALNKARDMYKLCMDNDRLETREIHFLNEVLDKSGIWPMLACRNDQLNPWQDYSDRLHENGFSNGLYNVIVAKDAKETSKYVITIREPTFSRLYIMLRNEYEYAKPYKKYELFLMKVWKMLLNERVISMDDDWLYWNIVEVVNFESELAELMLNLEEKKKPENIYKELTIEQLQKEYDVITYKSQIMWHNSISAIFAREGVNMTILPSEKLVIEGYEYLMNLASLLERSSHRVIANYMQWTVLRDWISYANTSIENILFEINKPYRGHMPVSERWKRCIHRNNIKIPVAYEYAKRYVQDEKKEDIKEIVKLIQHAVRKQISASTWIDNNIKTLSLNKLDNMNVQISMPDWYNAEAIDNYYENFTVSGDGYLENSINLYRYNVNKMLLKLRKPVEAPRLDFEPTKSAAFYIHENNTIVIPAGIMQDPIYDLNLPKYMIFGSLGFIIGHLINEAFVDEVHKCYEDSNCTQWWTPETLQIYGHTAKCFNDQYSNYRWPGSDIVKIAFNKDYNYVNGSKVMKQSMAHSAGIAAAFSAYKNVKVMDRVGLYGLEDYTNDQIFFMSYARTLCDHVTTIGAYNFMAQVILRGESKIIGSLSNLPEFAATYNCPGKETMNPIKKCIFWQ